MAEIALRPTHAPSMDACSKIALEEETRGPTLLLREFDRHNERVDLDRALAHARALIARPMDVEMMQCFCTGVEMKALVLTAPFGDHETAGRMRDLVRRLFPLMGDEVMLRGHVHLEAADLEAWETPP